MLVGGMPQSVAAYADGRDLMAVDRAKGLILGLYRNDIEKRGGLAAKRIKAVFDAIPGQEEDNANFLKIHDMGVRLQKDGDFAGQISSLIKEKKKLQEMRENCQHFDKSQSIPNLLALIRQLVEAQP